MRLEYFSHASCTCLNRSRRSTLQFGNGWTPSLYILEGTGVSRFFGGLHAIQNVSFHLEDGEITALIGPNGAGKTTLFNCITGFQKPTAGSIKFMGQEIAGRSPNRICRMGITRTFQITRPFLNMTCLDNVVVSAVFGRSKPLSVREAREEALNVLNFVGLEKKANVLGKGITLHERRSLEIARALGAKPKIVLFDEVMAGLNPQETDEASKLIVKVRDEFGVTLFWVEHLMRAVMNVAERIIVLQSGEKTAEGTPQEISKNQDVIDAYLGEEHVTQQ